MHQLHVALNDDRKRFTVEYLWGFSSRVQLFNKRLYTRLAVFICWFALYADLFHVCDIKMYNIDYLYNGDNSIEDENSMPH